MNDELHQKMFVDLSPFYFEIVLNPACSVVFSSETDRHCDILEIWNDSYHFKRTKNRSQQDDKVEKFGRSLVESNGH